MHDLSDPEVRRRYAILNETLCRFELDTGEVGYGMHENMLMGVYRPTGFDTADDQRTVMLACCARLRLLAGAPDAGSADARARTAATSATMIERGVVRTQPKARIARSALTTASRDSPAQAAMSPWVSGPSMTTSSPSESP